MIVWTLETGGSSAQLLSCKVLLLVSKLIPRLTLGKLSRQEVIGIIGQFQKAICTICSKETSIEGFGVT